MILSLCSISLSNSNIFSFRQEEILINVFSNKTSAIKIICYFKIIEPVIKKLTQGFTKKLSYVYNLEPNKIYISNISHVISQ